MKVAIPREVKNHEYRVAITPAGVHEFVRTGHEVFVESGAGIGSSITDEEFTRASALLGSAIVPTRSAFRPKSRPCFRSIATKRATRCFRRTA